MNEVKIGQIYGSKIFPLFAEFYVMPLFVDTGKNLVYYRYLSIWEEERVETIDRFTRSLKLINGENNAARYGRR